MGWRIPDWFPELGLEAADRLRIYHAELLRFNRALNLISRSSEPSADEMHFADSFLALQGIPELAQAQTIHDLGSGNGHPGLVAAILYPQMSVNLVESDLRKAEFLKHVASRLKLTAVKLVTKRIEELSVGSVKVALARGLATVEKTCGLCAHAMSAGGSIYHLKSATWSVELEANDRSAKTLWVNSVHHEYKLPASGISRAVIQTLKL